jgi:hypothetical protein
MKRKIPEIQESIKSVKKWASDIKLPKIQLSFRKRCEILKTKLATKEKLFIFEVLQQPDIDNPVYTQEIADDGITQQEFDTMIQDRRLHSLIIPYLEHCEMKIGVIKTAKEFQLKADEEFKKTILPAIYNNELDKEVADLYKDVQPLLIEQLKRFFNDDDLFSDDIAKLWSLVKNKNAELAVKAFEELICGERDIRQCVYCEKLFTPTPRGRDQKYCGGRCRRRDFYEKHEKKKR